MQLGNYMIDYDTLEMGRMIAGGVRIQIALLLSLYRHYFSNISIIILS